MNPMKRVMILMNVLMGATMSVVLSLVGTLLGARDKFTIQAWLLSCGVSFIISLIIGFAVPIKKLGDGMCKKVNVIPESFKGTLISACISDLIYTPIITIIMVVMMVSNARKQLAAAGITAGGPSIAQVLPLSLIVCLLVGYVVIVIVQPLFIKMLIRNVKR